MTPVHVTHIVIHFPRQKLLDWNESVIAVPIIASPVYHVVGAERIFGWYANLHVFGQRIVHAFPVRVRAPQSSRGFIPIYGCTLVRCVMPRRWEIMEP